MSVHTDGRGNPTTYTWDASYQVTRITDALGGHVDYGYDAAGQLVSVTDPNGDTRTATYTLGGNLASTIDPLGRTSSRAYDLAGRLTSATDPRGLTRTFTYDDAGQLVGQARPEGPVSYSYDNAGRRTSMVDPIGATTYAYDTTGRTTQIASPAGTLDYRYDSAGQLTSTARPDGTVTYEHDAAGRTTSIGHPVFGVTTVGWRADDQLDTITRPNGVDTSYSYDTAGRLVGLDHTGPAGHLAAFTSTLDANGNRTSLTIEHAGQATRDEDYTLDALNRVTNVDYGDGSSENFQYDPTGNVIERDAIGGPNAGTTSYTYDAAQQLTSSTSPVGSISYSYDAAGNLTMAAGPDGTDTYAWDSQSMLTAATVGGLSETYGYDAAKRRVSVDGAPQLWDPLTLGLPTLVDDSTDSYLYGPDGILATSSGDWLLADPLGSIRTTTSPGGSVTGMTAYDAYGATRATVGADSAFGYVGERADPTRLIHLRARQYDPALGRFLAADPLQPNAEGTQGWSLYGYAEANPTTLRDPSGYATLVGHASLVGDERKNRWAHAAGECLQEVVAGLTFGFVVGITYGVGITAGGFGAAGADVFQGCMQAAITRGLGPQIRPPGRVPKDCVGGWHSRNKKRGLPDGWESHHMPPSSVTGTEAGPAMGLPGGRPGHGNTGSHGGGGAAYRAEQTEMIQDGRYWDAFQKDIDDVLRRVYDKVPEYDQLLVLGELLYLADCLGLMKTPRR